MISRSPVSPPLARRYSLFCSLLPRLCCACVGPAEGTSCPVPRGERCLQDYAERRALRGETKALAKEERQRQQKAVQEVLQVSK